MSVDLEKIASMLEEANQKITELETDKDTLESKNQELEKELELSKEASVMETQWDSSLGSVYENSYDAETPEGKLDDFLNS